MEYNFAIKINKIKVKFDKIKLILKLVILLIIYHITSILKIIILYKPNIITKNRVFKLYIFIISLFLKLLNIIKVF